MTDDTNDTFKTDSEPGEQPFERTVDEANTEGIELDMDFGDESPSRELEMNQAERRHRRHRNNRGDTE